MNKLLPVSWRKKFSGLFNTALHVSWETLWDKRFFFAKKYIISNLFADFEWRNSRLWQNFSTKVSKLKSTWPVEIFEKKLFGGGYNFVSSYGFSEENLTGKNNRVLSGMHSRCPAEFSEGHFSGRNKIFQTFGLWARIFGLLTKHIWQNCQNCSPCDQRSFWIAMIFISLKKQHWIVFRPLAEEFRNLGKNIHQWCQTEIYVSTTTSNKVWTN